MRFSLMTVLSVMTASAVATLPSTCSLDQFYAENGHVGVTYTCRWWVCGQNNSWRLVRDCGTGNSCKAGSPTTCIDHVGNPF